MTARARGQNRRAAARGRAPASRAQLAKTRRSTPHAGGRPLLFIPAVVVERAREIAAQGRDFSTVVRMLAAEGNGAWPRKTLMRRVRSTSGSSAPARGQKVRRPRRLELELEQLERVDKTPAGDELSPAALEIESMIAAEPYGTRLYHELVAGLHAVLGGPCGCYLCGTTKAAG